MRTMLLPLALAFALVAPAAADHCTTYSTSAAQLDTDPACTGAPRFYVFEDSQVTILSIWIYEETNGICGLQRGDEIHDDTCHGLVRPDTIAF